MVNRPRVFYGWWVVSTAALGLCLGSPPILVFSFGVFLKALSQEFHSGRGAISFAFTLHNVISAVCGNLRGDSLQDLLQQFAVHLSSHRSAWIGTVDGDFLGDGELLPLVWRNPAQRPHW